MNIDAASQHGSKMHHTREPLLATCEKLHSKDVDVAEMASAQNQIAQLLRTPAINLGAYKIDSMTGDECI